MVSSIDGKFTRGDESDIHLWSSKEDNDHFIRLRDAYSLIVMGSGTYETIRETLQLSENKLRVVLTENPHRYAKERVENQLEFSSESPEILVERLSKRGYKKTLLVGGSAVAASFFKAHLVNEVYLTIEPKIFGKGTSLRTKKIINADLKLVSVKKINKKGTLLLRYSL